MEVGIAPKGKKTYSLRWALQDSDSLVYIKMHHIMTFFPFLCCLSYSVVDLKWEFGEGALLL